MTFTSLQILFQFRHMLIFCCREMDKDAIVSFHTVDKNIGKFIFPKLIDGAGRL